MPHVLPHLAWGDPAGRVVLHWQYASGTEAGYPDAAFDYAVYQELATTLCLPGTADQGLIPVTNRAPGVQPWNVITALVLGRYTLGWRDVGGNCPRLLCRNTNAGTSTVVWVGWRDDPRSLAAAVAHEAVHAFQTPDDIETHETEPVNGGPNLMHPSGPVFGRLSAGRITRVKAAITRHAAGDRFGAYLPLSGGAWSVGWANQSQVSFLS